MADFVYYDPNERESIETKITAPSFNPSLELNTFELTTPPLALQEVSSELKGLSWDMFTNFFNKNSIQGVNWDTTAATNYLRNNTFAKHTCATAVENALTKAGFPRIKCTENGGNGWAPALHYNGILKKHGWKLVDEGVMNGKSNSTNIQIKPGDLCVQGNSESDTKNAHVAYWDGTQWLSDYKQLNMSAYSNHGKVKYFIYRYDGINKAAFGMKFAYYDSHDIPSDEQEVIDLNENFIDSDLNYNTYSMTDAPEYLKRKPTSNGTISWDTFSNLAKYSPVLQKMLNTLLTVSTNEEYTSQKGYEAFVLNMNRYIPNASSDFKTFATDTAFNESRFTSNASDPRSTAKGYFGIVDGTWKEQGGGDRNNIGEQFRVLKKLYDSYDLRIQNSDSIKNWMKQNNYSKLSVMHAMHYVGSGNIVHLASTGKLASNKGVNMKTLNNILRGKKYNG